MRQNTGVGGALANAIAFAIFLLSGVACAAIAVFVFRPDLVQTIIPPDDTPVPTMTIPLPTAVSAAVVPSVTPTPTEDPLLRPTFTPVATSTSLPATETPTRRPTLTPSPVSTIPTRTPTPTPTVTNTPTNTPGPSLTPTNTLSPFPFTKSQSSPIYQKNFANGAGCDWMGVAGVVLDTNKSPVAQGQYRVRVWGEGLDNRVNPWDATDYGPSGWEQFLLNQVVIRTYNIQLETVDGTPVSQQYTFQTRSSCNENLIFFTFEQNR